MPGKRLPCEAPDTEPSNSSVRPHAAVGTVIDVTDVVYAPGFLAAPGHPSQVVAVGAGLLAFGLSLIVWPIVRFAVTIAHEGGHALTASMMGGSVDSIHVHRKGHPDGLGVTYFRSGPVGTFFALLAGYIGPSAFGLGGAVLLTAGRVTVVLWLSLFFLALALFQAGNLLGRFAMIVIGAVIVLVMRYGSAGQQVFFAYTWIWFLLFGGFGHVLVLQQGRKEGGDTGSDAYQLRRMTFLPASLWSGFFWLLTLGALLYGGGILLGIVRPGDIARLVR